MVPSVCDAVTLDGKLFQTRGAATKKARSAVVSRRDDGVTRADVDAERNACTHMPRHIANKFCKVTELGEE